MHAQGDQLVSDAGDAGERFALYAIKNDTRRLEARVQAQERALERAENDVAVLTAERAHLCPARAARAAGAR